MTEEWKPDWNLERAMATFNKHHGKVFKRPNGEVRYTLLTVELLYEDKWGIRLRCWPKGNTYVVAHNTIEEEGWVVV